MNRSRSSGRCALLLLALLMVGSAGAALAQNAPDPAEARFLPAQLVDTLNALYGQHAGARAAHAKGVTFEGQFKPSRAAPSISKAPHLRGPVPVVVRFSAFSGVPSIADNDGQAGPRGLAIKFKLPNCNETDIVAHTLNGFPSATATDFHELLTAMVKSAGNVARPTPLDTYLDGHPVTKAMLSVRERVPASYGTVPYFGANAFKFSNARNQVTFGRYRLLPVAGARFLTDQQAANLGANALGDEIRRRVKARPVKFKLVLQLAGPSDNLNDPSLPWPESRKLVELGVITIVGPPGKEAAADKALVFLHSALSAGIEAQDPMISVRSNAYVVSFERRQ